MSLSCVSWIPNIDVGLGEDYEEVLADVGCNADLCVVNQESTDLLREAHAGTGDGAQHHYLSLYHLCFIVIVILADLSS